MWFEGAPNPFEDFDAEENQKRYEMEQRQRTMERRIRKTKREAMGLKTAKDSAKTPETEAEFDLAYQRKAALLQEQNAAYKEYCKDNDLKELQDRLAIAKWDRKQAAAARGAARRLENRQNNGTIELNRNLGNKGVFSSLPERMSKKHIREIAKEFGISMDGITLYIEKNPEFLKLSLTGRAEPEEIGAIRFFPNAFKSKEEVLRTLYHEKIHVEQFHEYGKQYVQNNNLYFEKIAYQRENDFISKLRKEGRI